MRIGVPKEIRPGERRVAATPETVARLSKLGFEVAVETGAGAGAAFLDEDYEKAGARIAASTHEVWELADIVLPVLQWAEEEGTMTSLEGRVIRRRRALPGPEGARSELWIMAEIARRLGAASTWSTDPAEVFDELARASEGGVADYSGLSHELLDTGVEAYWPYRADGTPRPFTQRFAHADGRARLVAVDATPPTPTDRGGAQGDRRVPRPPLPRASRRTADRSARLPVREQLER